ncbi:Hypothetical protein LUCI_4350 [Lucifera butyrica]|uniref:Chemotaxis methyl-accepting receptor n=1 Tax=Lucifera butyrica TaxID=1351585 RepID=A0A498RC22_9FIRM|nr:methyl-accepting chemotaxis protein [Lucifera butyrica]VBB09064.1 Hypothetical protein LUCI_4350 [Lucifera butyrica]
MNLKAKLTAIFSLLTIAVLLASSIAGYMFTKELVAAGIREEMKAAVSSHVNKLDGWLIGKSKMLEITAGTIHSVTGDGEITVPMVAGYKTVDNELSDMYFGSAAGKMVDGSGWTPPADYDPRVRPWYKLATEQSKLVFTDPYLDMVTKQMAVSVAMPIKNAAGQVRGVVAEDILLKTLVDNVKAINLHGAGYAFLFDAKGFILAHRDADLVSKNIFKAEKLKNMVPIFKDIMSKDHGFTQYADNGQSWFMVYQKVPLTGWTLAINVPEAVVYQPLAKLRWLFGLIALISILVVVLITFIVAKRITKPMAVLAGQVGQVAGGDLTVQAAVEGKDEMAQLAAGFNQMTHNLRDLISKVHGSAEQVAASSEELTASSHESAQASNQVAGSVTEIAQGADSQLTAVQKTSSVVEGMSASIQKAAADANQAVAKSVQAVDKAKDSSISVGKAVDQMKRIETTVNTSAEVVTNLGERSREIGQIVDTIAGIAGQTNLLALNAAIEAARAGEQGRGFAVVAEEVRKLAEQSEEAAKQIAALISEIQGDTAKAVSAMNDGTREVSQGTEIVSHAGGAFREIAELVTQVSNQVTEISAALRQMESGGQQIVASVKAINDLSKKTAAEAETVSAATEEQSASMQEIASASQNLANMAQELQKTINHFRI